MDRMGLRGFFASGGNRPRWWRALVVASLVICAGMALFAGATAGARDHAAALPSVDFGTVVVGQTSASVAVTVNNPGTAPLTVTSVALSGAQADEFSIDSDPCDGNSVPTGGSCAITLTFRPTAPGPAAGELTYTDNGPDSPQTLMLSGEGKPVPAPVQGRTALVGQVTGPVTLRLKGSTKFIPLTSSQDIPFGSGIDAIHGSVTLTVSEGGRERAATLTHGRFILTQDAHTALTVFHLSLPLTGCPAGQMGIVPTARGRVASHRVGGQGGSPRTRSVTASDHGGRFATRGQFAAASVEGTEWRTVDSCTTTTVFVLKGRVRVTDLHTGQAVTVRAGHHVVVHRGQ